MCGYRAIERSVIVVPYVPFSGPLGERLLCAHHGLVARVASGRARPEQFDRLHYVERRAEDVEFALMGVDACDEELVLM